MPAPSRSISASFTRPSNTTAYTAADVVANSTTAATILTFSGVVSVPGGSGIISSAWLIDSAAESTKLQADLFLFAVAPVTYGNDADAFAPTDSEMFDCVGVIEFDGPNDFVVGSGNGLIPGGFLGGHGSLRFQCAQGSVDIYGVLVARNAYTPASAEVFKILIGITPD